MDCNRIQEKCNYNDTVGNFAKRFQNDSEIQFDVQIKFHFKCHLFAHF